MSRFAGTAPPTPRGLDRAGIVAVEEVGTPGKELQIRGFQAIDEHDHQGAVRVLIAVSQPDRLNRRVAVASRTVRQETALLVSPERRVEVFDPFGRTCPDHDAMTLRPRSLEEPRQSPLQRGRQKVVKADFGQTRLIQEQ